MVYRISKNKLFNVVFLPLASILIIACSRVISINLKGEIIGGNPNIQYSFEFLEFGKVYNDTTFKINGLNSFDLLFQFRNSPPQCISLVIGKIIHDRYCHDDGGNFRNKRQYLKNVFTDEKVEVLNLQNWDEIIELENLDFSIDNYLKNKSVLLFDKVDFEIINSKSSESYVFKITDLSNSIDSITVFSRDSQWENKKATIVDSEIRIPMVELNHSHEKTLQMVSLRIYSKYGWYKDVRKYLRY